MKAIIGAPVSFTLSRANTTSTTAESAKPQTCSGFRPMRSIRNHDIPTDAGITNTSSIRVLKVAPSIPIPLAIRFGPNRIAE